MNLPNKLTLARIVMIPFFVVFMLWNGLPHRFLIALVIFAVASFTDMLDGQIARKYNLVTDFGKFMDPIADKLLVCAAYIAFVQLDICSAWAMIFILAREFAVQSMRMLAATTGKVIAANYWGKVKTVSQMAASILVLLLLEIAEWSILPAGFPIVTICGAMIWFSVILTVISGVVYLVQNKSCLGDLQQK